MNEEKDSKTFITTIKGWLIPISTSFSIVTVAMAAWQSLGEYQLKLESENRLAQSMAIESDIKLFKQFEEMISIANSRRGTYYSEAAVNQLFDNELFTEEELSDFDAIDEKIEDIGILDIDVAMGEQLSFIQALTTLAIKHPILRESASQALTRFTTSQSSEIIETSAECLKRLNAAIGDSNCEEQHE